MFWMMNLFSPLLVFHHSSSQNRRALQYHFPAHIWKLSPQLFTITDGFAFAYALDLFPAPVR